MPRSIGSIATALGYFAAISPAATYKPLSDNFLKLVPSAGADVDPINGALLAPLLVSRAPGTPGHIAAQQHITSFFATQLPRWTSSWQNSSSLTPASPGQPVPFSNLIFRREPPWTQPGQANLLTFAAHYDSRPDPLGYVGAVDAAASCALVMHVARALDKYVQQMYEEMAALGEGGTVPMDMGVQVVFLDGRGVYESATEMEGLFGSRALAAAWENQTNPAMSDYGYPDQLNQISLFVLLGLLGAPEPAVPSSFQTTHWAYQGMANIESRMRNMSLLETQPVAPFLFDSAKTGPFELPEEDDHVPFQERGVEILRVAPGTEPPLWDTIADDGKHLDMPTVRDWSKIITTFALEWLDMMEVEPQEGAGTILVLREHHQ